MPPLLRSPQGRCRLGVGRADITPPADVYHRHWGAALHDRAEGIHRPLTATAVLVEPVTGGDGHVIFALDLGWLGQREMAALLARLREATGFGDERVVVTFSHTHAAVNLDTERLAEPGGEHIEPYLAALTGLLLEAFAAARDRLTPVDLTYGTGSCGLAMHRDAHDAERGIYVCGPNPDGPTDATIGLVRATDAEGATVAVLVNYACHPTTLAWDNRLVSPDYVGALRETVEEALGAPCIFLQGAAGDLGPVRGFVGDVATADSNGRQLGYSVLAGLEALPPPRRQWTYRGPVLSGATVGEWTWACLDEARQAQAQVFASQMVTVSLPYRQLRSKAAIEADITTWTQRQQQAANEDDAAGVREARARIERLRRALRKVEALPRTGVAEYEIRLWRLGEGVLVMFGGEPYHQLQTSLRHRFPDTALTVVELCNLPHSYLLPRERYGLGLYQEEVCVLAAGCLEAIEAATVQALEAWGLP